LKFNDYTKPSDTRQLATEEERDRRRKLQEERKRRRQVVDKIPLVKHVVQLVARIQRTLRHPCFVGRYDEDRVGLYESDMYRDANRTVGGYGGTGRTVHVGVDLDGSVGTPVYAFCAGTVHGAGYNGELGDYGHVIVVRHNLPRTSDDDGDDSRVVYALYGHLDEGSSAAAWEKGDPVKAGQLLGRMGDVHENGGWFNPHVHFQLAVHPPDTHDMPGAVSPTDRARALLEYPDPRYVLGELY
jgi:murein DD-endopeptidase MepM/ murein hydrolase activator NlpD